MFSWIVGTAVTIVIAVLVIGAIVIYNTLQRLRYAIARANANIDVLLKQRFDEIPQLVRVCANYASFERKTLQALTELRAQFDAARDLRKREQLDRQLTNQLVDLAATAESYPELKTSEQFLNLQRRVSDLEMEIADRREFSNQSVTEYNVRIASFPDLLVARIFRYTPMPVFEVESEARDSRAIEAI
jgi:LemA protein